MNQELNAKELTAKEPERKAPNLSKLFSRAVAPLLVVASMCSVQLGAALSRPATLEYGTISITWLRLCFAAFALAAIIRPPLNTYSRKHWFAAIALGSAAACMTLCFFEAVRRMPLALAVAINFLGPLAVATFSVRKPALLAWPVLAAAGVLLLIRDNGTWVVALADLVFPIGAACGWAAYIVLTKHVGTLFEGLEGLAVSLITAAVVTTPFGLLQSGGHLPPRQLIDAAYLSVLVPLVPYALELIALRRMSASVFAILMSAEPAIAAAIGFIILQQPMSTSRIFGTLCVITASICAILVEKPISLSARRRVRARDSRQSALRPETRNQPASPDADQ
ncbi:EamA family transporter [Trinickia symbiotica]|uniref:EamA family transporter n=1 Tax=Trinickia symbiotica TaxID=863227 RepID=A0A2T3XL69_9BURK|nr:EamA family transporter [Trinickia symbiotica]PTB17270.1 EamA family transporter [Trinickia symbiotica]